MAEKINYTPLGNRVIVKPIEKKDDVKIGGIIVPDIADHLQFGEVVASGKGDTAPQTGELIPNETKPGDTVLFIKGMGVPIIIAGQQYILMREGGSGQIECIIGKE